MPLWRVAGATLFVYVTTVGGLFALVALALPYSHRQARWLFPTVGVLGPAAAVYAAVIGGTWIALLFFGENVPFTDALAVVPVIMLVQTLPLTPQGLGTRDAVALELLTGYADGAPNQGAAAVAAATLT